MIRSLIVALVLALAGCEGGEAPGPDASPLGEDPGYETDPRPVDYDAGGGAPDAERGDAN